MKIKRDFMEGTEFDLTVGLAAGPFGNPNRYPTPSGVKPEEYKTMTGIGLYLCSDAPTVS